MARCAWRRSNCRLQIANWLRSSESAWIGCADCATLLAQAAMQTGSDALCPSRNDTLYASPPLLSQCISVVGVYRRPSAVPFLFSLATDSYYFYMRNETSAPHPLY